MTSMEKGYKEYMVEVGERNPSLPLPLAGKKQTGAGTQYRLNLLSCVVRGEQGPAI